MIPRDCKRLADMGFHIAALSRHAARERSIRRGQPDHVAMVGREKVWAVDASCVAKQDELE